MNGIITLLLANFKKRKSQSILIFIIIVFSAIMFTTSICISTSMGKPFEKMYETLNASQIQIMSSHGFYDTQNITDWWAKTPGVQVQTFKYHYSDDRLLYNGQKISEGTVFFTERPDEVLTQDLLSIAEGEIKNCPESGEVWICISFADKYGIKTGDFIEISAASGQQKLKVSAIVADPQFGAPSMGILRFWIAPDELSELFDTETGNGDFIGFLFDDYSKKDILWEQFESYLGKPFIGNVLDYDLISSAYLMMYRIMGAILLVFSLILLIIAVFIITFTISSAVISDVKTIGILRAQGYTPFSIKMLYSLQYYSLSVFSVPLGILLSAWVVELISGMLTRAMGMTAMDISLAFPALAAFILITSAVGIISFLSAGKAGRLKPIKAIKEDLLEIKTTKAVNFSRLGSIPVPMLIAVKNLFTQKIQSILIFLCIIALSSVLTFSANLLNTFSNSNFLEKVNEWGMDEREDTLVFKESAGPGLRNELLEKLKTDERTKLVLPVRDMTLSARIEAQNGKPYKNLQASVYDGDISSLGIGNLEGRNPASNTEISISALVSREYGKKAGDYITVSIAGKEAVFLITGIYQSALRMGWNLRLQISAVREIIPDYQLYTYALIYNSPEARASFTEEYARQYKDEIDIQSHEDSIKSGFIPSIHAGVYSLVTMISSIFILVILIIIFNSTLVNVYREKKILGMYKSIGMTPVQVRMTIVWRMILLTALGSITGMVLSCLVGGKLMKFTLLGMGMVKYPEVINPFGVMLVLPGCLIIGFISSWIPSSRIHNISPRSLIAD